MMYLDLAELGDIFEKRWLWSDRRLALAQFRRDDHFGDPAISLDQAVRDLSRAHWPTTDRAHRPAYAFAVLWIRHESNQYLLLL